MTGRAARLAMLLPPLAIAACASDFDQPGTGWSRAPDLSVFASMEMYGGIAREQSILCQGFRPEAVRAAWREDFGARQIAVEAALAARHGDDAVRRASLAPVRRIACREVPDSRWRHQYARMLRLLEARLGLA
ncbi:MAG: hypothetical protein ACT4N8_08220 [Sphingosinicella sp.]|uniref:hypothetical protein n=1 Tax=Sphingosinicella sp. TaxID=1917971 RepID=UPI0040379AAF